MPESPSGIWPCETHHRARLPHRVAWRVLLSKGDKCLGFFSTGKLRAHSRLPYGILHTSDDEGEDDGPLRLNQDPKLGITVVG